MKILVCGSAGFLGSNFIRYLLYNSKDYDMVSVDKLVNPEHHKLLYIHKKHKFYLGDISDFDFMSRVVYIEKPDVIVNFCFYTNKTDLGIQKIIESVICLNKLITPVIQVTPYINEHNDKLGVWNSIKKITLNSKNTIVQIPNLIGQRQNTKYQLPKILKEIFTNNKNKNLKLSDAKIPYIYAEEVCSLIWYLIETGNGLGQENILNYTGIMSEVDLFEKIKNMYELKDYIIELNNDKNNDIMFNNEIFLENWKSDYNINIYLNKTILWYDVNKWAIYL